MGHDPNKEPPFFSKRTPTPLFFPALVSVIPETRDVHHEEELVVALRSGGDSIAASKALGCVYGYAVGLDMTRRDLPSEPKKLGALGNPERHLNILHPAAQYAPFPKWATR